MKRIWTVAAGRHGQTDGAWAEVGATAREVAGEKAVSQVGEIMWLVDTADGAAADATAEALTPFGADVIRSARTVYEESDYADADLIGISGIDLSIDPPFVRNTARAYRDDPPCLRCGHHDPFDVTVRRPPRIDESMLDAPAPDGSRPGPRGWELVNLPDGALLLSTRLVGLLREARIEGLAVEPVLNARGATSTRMAALRATVAVLTPCPRHTVIDGGPFCPACGTAHGSVDGWFWVPRSTIGRAEIVSRHPHRAAMIYLSPRAHRLLDDVPGVRRGDPVRVCAD